MGATAVTLRVLGRFDIVVDGRAMGDVWPSRRSTELVQLLAISPGNRLTRDEIIEALWPHLTADAGAANLRKATHHARRALGDDAALVASGQQLALYPDACLTTDLATFLAAADAALALGDVEEAASAAFEYGGPLLPDARYEDWTVQLRRHVEQRYLECLRLAGRWDDVIELDPTDEASCREAMRAALAIGHRHRALALYGRLREALRDDLGVMPSADTNELYDMSRAGLVPARPTILGRHHELAVVDELVQRPDRGAEFVVIRGVAGIGKTALADELASRAAESGWVTARVTADDPNDAYSALALLCERLADGRGDVLTGLDGKTRSVLGSLISVGGETAPLDLPLTRHQMVGATQRLVAAVGGGSGVAVVVDDVDRADQASLEAIALLGDRGVGRLIVAVTCRDPVSTRVERALARAARIRAPIELRLGTLDDAAAEALVRRVDPEIDADALATIVRRAEGVPFFAVELAGAHRRGDAGWRGSPAGVIEARLVDMPEDEIAWLRRLAIAGGQLDLDLVVALSGIDEAEADRLLDDALQAGVLVVDDGGYRFRHELVRATLAEQLPPHQQAAVHRDAARRLAELGARPGRIAAHWAAGRRPQQAADWFVRAAEVAVELGGYRAALEQVDLALAHVADHPAALRRRAEALDALGDARALAAYDAAIEVAGSDDVQELRPLQALAQIKMGDPEGALVTIAGAQPKSLASQLAQALTMSGAALLGATTPEAGTRLSAAGRRRALASGDAAAVVVASWSQAAAAHARGELRESLRDDLADTHAIPQLATTVFDGQLCITQRLLYGNRPYDDVIRFTNDFAAEADRLGAARAVAFATTLRGEAELLSGRLDDAERDLRAGVRLHRDLAAATGESFSLQRLAELAYTRGDTAEARRLLDQALEIARTSDVGFHLFDRIYGTRIQLAVDPAEALDAVIDAEEAVRGPFETCPGCRITLDVPAAIAVARAGDLDRLERYERSCTFLAQVVMRLPAWDAALEEVRAHVRLAHGDRTAAARGFSAAARTFAAVGQPIDAERCSRQAADAASGTRTNGPRRALS